MAFVQIVSFVTVCLLSVHANQPDKAVTTGEDLTLDCWIGDVTLTDSTGVYWTRNDLEWPQYILMYRGHFDRDNQDPRYHNRIKHPEFKHNNLSLTIQNVSKNDSGTYECKLIRGGKGLHMETIKTVNLSVTEPEMYQDPDKKNLWLNVGLPVTAAVLLVAAPVALGFFMFKKTKWH